MASAAARRATSGKVSPPPVETQQTAHELDPSIQSIIDQGRTQQAAAAQAARGTWILPGLTAGMLWACFTPLNFSSLAWIALVPLCLLIRTNSRKRHLYRTVYFWGFVWTAITLQWMRLGHPSMYVALTAMSVYVAFYFPLFVGLSRVAVHRCRVPLVLAVPIVWTGLEFVRAYMLTGFSWYYLGHSQYRWVELIQVSDLVGAYGVSFLVAMANAGLAMLIPASVFAGMRLGTKPKEHFVVSRRPWLPGAACVLVLALAVAYGFARRGQAEFQKGPRVALIQGNFTSEVKHDPQKARDIVWMHDKLTHAAMQHGQRQENPSPRPEIIVWPESMFPWPTFSVQEGMTDEEVLRLRPPNSRLPHAEFLKMFRGDQSFERLSQDARAYNAAMLVGINSLHGTPERQEQRNSVAFLTPQMGHVDSYHKMHLVMFGEYVPLKKQLPLLARFTPYGSEFGLEHGTEARVFEYAGAKFAPIVCFEDTVPQLVRGIVKSAAKSEQAVDFLVNNTNDGWFHGSSELDQHLITAAFRCVETRTPMVRSVNTGISAFIDGDGVIREPEVFIDGDDANRTFRDASGNWTKQLNAALVDNIPLDNRESVYVQTGDVFAGSCGLSCFLLLGAGVFFRRKDRSNAA